MTAAVIMVQGTASSVGKSMLVTALCRSYARRGFRAAPFKAQNMALNSAVTIDGGEIGRAQAAQAEAAGVEPSVDMNPLLLKPEGATSSQLVAGGRVTGTVTARDYHVQKPALRQHVAESLQRLRARTDMVVIEGAGSPAEINLKQHDLVNMDVARRVSAPVLLVGDIDRGGVFAAFVGTMELLEPEERSLVAGFVINKLRGDARLLGDGPQLLEARTGVPVMGVIPHVERLRLAEEDSVALDDRVTSRPHSAHRPEVVVVRLPRISNYDDVEALEHDPEVAVRFVEDPSEACGADLVILPGSKCTVNDLGWLREQGLADLIHERVRDGLPTMGICGGCQMLGRSIEDPDGIESTQSTTPGLGWLPLRTRFRRRKTTARVRARVRDPSFLNVRVGSDVWLSGYEIHMGDTVRDTPTVQAPFEIERRNDAHVEVVDGAIGANGAVVGTMIHGLLENEPIRRQLVTFLWERRGEPAPRECEEIPTRDAEYDRLADVVEQHLDMGKLDRVVFERARLETPISTRRDTMPE